ncbi:MAG TPA: hypothetical protein VIQ24_01170 [Pyrinomonadaceae bacterium]
MEFASEHITTKGQQRPPRLVSLRKEFPMFHFLSQSSFQLWFGIGVFIAVIAGVASVNHEALFGRRAEKELHEFIPLLLSAFIGIIAKQIFIGFCGFALIGIAIKIGWSNSIIAALVSIFVFCSVMGLSRGLLSVIYKRVA